MDLATRLSRTTGLFSSPALRQITIEVEKVGGINLGQGVCNLPPPPILLERAAEAAKNGWNRYSNPRGLLSLREAIAIKLSHFNGIEANPETEILVTCGATGGIEAACAALLNPGDEVIVFEPTYPYHIQALRRYGATIRTVPLAPPNWDLDFDRIREAITDRTKFILLNSPGNPTGKVFSRADLKQLGELLTPTDVLVVTDEIYEYMTFDGQSHASAASIPELAGRTITVGGYSKTFAITGWRIGYLVVPDAISEAFTAFLDAVYVCPPTPLQQGVADAIVELGDEFYADLNRKYQRKRDLFFAGLQRIGLEPLNSEGAYYMICSFGNRFPKLTGGEFVARMIAETGVGAVPSSDFVRDHENAKWVRFCLAQEDSVLEDALNRLGRLQA